MTNGLTLPQQTRPLTTSPISELLLITFYLVLLLLTLRTRQSMPHPPLWSQLHGRQIPVLPATLPLVRKQLPDGQWTRLTILVLLVSPRRHPLGTSRVPIRIPLPLRVTVPRTTLVSRFTPLLPFNTLPLNYYPQQTWQPFDKVSTVNTHKKPLQHCSLLASRGAP